MAAQGRPWLREDEALRCWGVSPERPHQILQGGAPTGGGGEQGALVKGRREDGGNVFLSESGVCQGR